MGHDEIPDFRTCVIAVFIIVLIYCAGLGIGACCKHFGYMSIERRNEMNLGGSNGQTCYNSFINTIMRIRGLDNYNEQIVQLHHFINNAFCGQNAYDEHDVSDNLSPGLGNGFKYYVTPKRIYFQFGLGMTAETSDDGLVTCLPRYNCRLDCVECNQDGEIWFACRLKIDSYKDTETDSVHTAYYWNVLHPTDNPLHLSEKNVEQSRNQNSDTVNRILNLGCAGLFPKNQIGQIGLTVDKVNEYNQKLIQEAFDYEIQ